jgi:thiamine-phosphate pyrophosphorylase
MKQEHLSRILVTQKGDRSLSDYLLFIDRWIDAGVTAVQLREKQLSSSALFAFAQALQQRLQVRRIPLIINDHLDLCLAVGAAGLHLGQTDGDVWQARQCLGENIWLGLSANSLTQVQAANQLSVNYIGVGAVFPTDNKANVERVWGLAGLAAAVQVSNHPVVAIGGINTANAAAVEATGVAGIAAIAAYHEE